MSSAVLLLVHVRDAAASGQIDAEGLIATAGPRAGQVQPSTFLGADFVHRKLTCPQVTQGSVGNRIHRSLEFIRIQL